MKIKRIIQTEIIIDAPAGLIWQHLSALSEYPRWNPFLVKAGGVLAQGEHLHIEIRNGQSSTRFSPVVGKVQAPFYFEWTGSLLHKSIFAGHHYFRLEPVNEKQTKLIHGENFSGILAGIIFKKIGNETRSGFIRMNQALKERSEQHIS